MPRSIASLLQALEPLGDLSKEEVRESLLQVANDYQFERDASGSAPRLRELRGELRGIANRVKEAQASLRSLRSSISGASHCARDVLVGDDILSFNVRGLYPIDPDPLDGLRIEAGLADDGWSMKLEDPIAKYIASLESLEQALRLKPLRRLLEALMTEIPPDKGGRGNIYIDRWGSPKWTVAEGGYRLFLSCQYAGAETLPTVDGPLLSFVEDLLEWCSDGTERGETIRPYLQHVAAWEQRRIEIETEILRVYEDLANPANREERLRIQKRLVSLQEALNTHMPRKLRPDRSENNPARKTRG